MNIRTMPLTLSMKDTIEGIRYENGHITASHAFASLFMWQKEMGLSILFISHDMRVVYQLSQRVMIMKDGEIVESGDVEQVYFHPEHPYTKKLLEAAGILEEGD